MVKIYFTFLRLKSNFSVHKPLKESQIKVEEMQKMFGIIEEKFSAIMQNIKELTCENIMILRSKFLDARLEFIYYY